MTDTEYCKLGNNKCNSLSLVFGMHKRVLGGPHIVSLRCIISNNPIDLKIIQCLKREVIINSLAPIPLIDMWSISLTIEHLLMLFDGMFFDLERIEYSGNALTKETYESYAVECESRRLSYHKTDPAYRYFNHMFINFDEVLTPELILAWNKLKTELDIIHQAVLYNIADTGVTHDVKCAYLIESCEPLVEIIELYNKFFPHLYANDNRRVSLKTCIDAIISEYGKDIFKKEYSINKHAFLKRLVDTRHRMMHIKRNLSGNTYLSGEESVLYLAKMSHLYRVVILSLLGIKYDIYKSRLENSVQEWDNWHNVLDRFTSTFERL